MARIARVVATGLPHHVTQRGNRRQPTFFSDDDYRYYLDLLREWCTCHEVLVWSYCLMPNHVHLIVVPKAEDGLKLAIGETHRRYSRMINFRMKQTKGVRSQHLTGIAGSKRCKCQKLRSDPYFIA